MSVIVSSFWAFKEKICEIKSFTLQFQIKGKGRNKNEESDR